MIPFNFHGHTVLYDPSTWGAAAYKADCSVPNVVCAAIVFMHDHGVQRLVVDAVTVNRGPA